ncbi:hypothetical protein NG798_11205 [Ancylothrix sp. C2]|uniref:hypothetical protein n=1 Tax=Ancylothrix sp. D3o TaxID=2953691 RepID=UPI0021BA66BA|nr:hypothetical protein [Ancylothrix sp. D3o]MCT7950358.1 hypothetical protein [Ancylothrix sp. D3o]
MVIFNAIAAYLSPALKLSRNRQLGKNTKPIEMMKQIFALQLPENGTYLQSQVSTALEKLPVTLFRPLVRERKLWFSQKIAGFKADYEGKIWAVSQLY